MFYKIGNEIGFKSDTILNGIELEFIAKSNSTQTPTKKSFIIEQFNFLEKYIVSYKPTLYTMFVSKLIQMHNVADSSNIKKFLDKQDVGVYKNVLLTEYFNKSIKDVLHDRDLLYIVEEYVHAIYNDNLVIANVKEFYQSNEMYILTVLSIYIKFIYLIHHKMNVSKYFNNVSRNAVIDVLSYIETNSIYIKTFPFRKERSTFDALYSYVELKIIAELAKSPTIYNKFQGFGMSHFQLINDTVIYKLMSLKTYAVSYKDVTVSKRLKDMETDSEEGKHEHTRVKEKYSVLNYKLFGIDAFEYTSNAMTGYLKSVARNTILFGLVKKKTVNYILRPSMDETASEESTDIAKLASFMKNYNKGAFISTQQLKTHMLDNIDKSLSLEHKALINTITKLPITLYNQTMLNIYLTKYNNPYIIDLLSSKEKVIVLTAIYAMLDPIEYPSMRTALFSDIYNKTDKSSLSKIDFSVINKDVSAVYNISASNTNKYLYDIVGALYIYNIADQVAYVDISKEFIKFFENGLKL